MALKINFSRDKAVSVLLAEEDHELYSVLANQLGVSMSQIILNAASASLMTSFDPVAICREQYVTDLACVDRWRRERDEVKS